MQPAELIWIYFTLKEYCFLAKYEIMVPECLKRLYIINLTILIYVLSAINKMHFLGEKAFIFNLRSDVKMQKENVHQI